MTRTSERSSRALTNLILRLSGRTDIEVGKVVSVGDGVCDVQPEDEDAPIIPDVILNVDGSGHVITPVIGSTVILLRFGAADAMVLFYGEILQLEIDATKTIFNKGLNGGVPKSLAISTADNVQIANINILYAKMAAFAGALLADPFIVGGIMSQTRTALAAIAGLTTVVPNTVPTQYENPKLTH